MVLDRECRQLSVLNPFDGVVVEVDMGQRHFVRKRRGVDGKAMVLGGDFHLPRRQILDGLVAAPMAEFEFEGLPSERQSDQLMAEALRVSGLKTKREAVEAGLKALTRLRRQEDIRRYRGKLTWDGDLDAMRTD